MDTRTAYTLGSILIAACSGAPHDRTTVDPAPRLEPSVPQHAAQPIEHRPFGSSPITEFGTGISDLALAAIWHQPLPAPPIATDRALGSSPQVVWSERSLPLPRRLDAIAFAMTIEIVLKVGEPAPDAEGPARWGSVLTTIALSANGARLIGLRPLETSNAPIASLPSGLSHVPELANDLLSGLRRSDLAGYDLTEEDRRLLSNDSIWAQLEEDRPEPALLRGVAEMLASLPNAPLGYRFDDLSVLARSEEDQLYALSLEVERAGDGYVLATTPLVHVRRIWPR